MKMDKLISVVMPALNSENTIEKALSSVRMQTINQDEIEILVIDGGSIDRTREIAEEYDARIIENPEVVPEAAKRKGLEVAKGKYLLWLDTDEELLFKDQLEKRINLFQRDQRIKTILLDGYVTPYGYSWLAEYINCYGDAFSFFIYNLDASWMVNSLEDNKIKEYEEGNLYHFDNLDIIPIGDGGSTMFDMDYVRENFPSGYYSQSFAVTIFQSIVMRSGYLGIVPGDKIKHYATTTFQTFLQKLRFRAITNIHNLPGFGFSERAKNNKKINTKKLLYILYCIFIPWPLYDALRMMYKRKNINMIGHIIITYYILFQIIWQYLLKFLGVQPDAGSYGKKL
jgi:glycosyltransferase involved in cell wall biosynthesis